MSEQGSEPTRYDTSPVPGAAVPEAGSPTGGPPTGPVPPVPGEESPDWRRWIIGGLVALILLVVLALLLLGGDDGGDAVATDDGSTTTSSSSSTSSSSTSSSSTSSTSSSTSTTSTTVAGTTTSAPAATTTTAAPTTTTTTAPVVTVPPSTCALAGDVEANPGAAAQTVYDAFERDDRACADTLMNDASLQELFAKVPQPRAFQGCETVGDRQDCSFFTGGGGATAIHLIMEFANGTWQVVDVTETAG